MACGIVHENYYLKINIHSPRFGGCFCNLMAFHGEVTIIFHFTHFLCMIESDIKIENSIEVTQSVDHFFDAVVPQLELSEHVFKPDQWTKAFLKGINSVDFSDRKDVLEIGVGSGINMIYLLQKYNDIFVIGTDIVQQALDTAKRNIQNLVGTEALQRCAFYYGRDLQYFGSEIGDDVSDIIGCIPQIVVPHGVNLAEKDNTASYYDPKFYQSVFDWAGLGLNDAVLKKAHAILPIGGRAILNLGGRPSKKLLIDMFNQYQYRVDILHEEMIEQTAPTSLEPLIEVERQRNDFTFEFFTDESGKNTINADEAERRRRSGESLYHKIYVIQGTKIN